jgi:hypothetical protein
MSMNGSTYMGDPTDIPTAKAYLSECRTSEREVTRLQVTPAEQSAKLTLLVRLYERDATISEMVLNDHKGALGAVTQAQKLVPRIHFTDKDDQVAIEAVSTLMREQVKTLKKEILVKTVKT